MLLMLKVATFSGSLSVVTFDLHDLLSLIDALA
jgi:hypothetical protein